MRKLLPYMCMCLLMCGFVVANHHENLPIIREFKMSKCLGECYKERVSFRNYHNHILTLHLDMMANCANRELVVRKYSGDTLYLLHQPAPSKSYRIDEVTGDTLRIRKGEFCDCFFNIEMTIDSVSSDPKYVRIEKYLIIDTLMKKYDKIGRLGEIQPVDTSGRDPR